MSLGRWEHHGKDSHHLVSVYWWFFSRKHSCGICSSDKPPAASHEEKEHHERSPVNSSTASAVGMLKHRLDFLKKCDWRGGRKGLALFMLTHVSQLSRQQSFLHQLSGDIHSPREDTAAHLFHR